MKRLKRSGAVIVAILALSLTACVNEDSSNAQPAPGGNPAEPGNPPAGADQLEARVVKGRITKADGQPLANVEVGALNTFTSGSYLYGVSDQDGYYRIDMSDAPNTTWRMFGGIDVEYEGQQYTEDLWVDTTSFATDDGAIRHYEWRLTGLRPGFDDYYYGGFAYVYEGFYDYEWGDPEPVTIEDMEWVETTFEPTAPLIDGSQGQTVTRQGSEPEDIPMGKYRVSARYLPPDGTPVDLLIRESATDSEYGASVELVFDTDHRMILDVLHPQ